MEKYTILAIAGLILLLLGLIAFLGGVGQYQAQQRFDNRVADDQSRFEKLNATGGYEVYAYNSPTRSLDCPDNPYTDSAHWLGGGFLAMAVGGGVIYYDIEKRH